MKPFEDWQDPDMVGQSEYRAIFDCVADALEDVPEDEHLGHAIEMLKEFESWAKEMRRPLEQAVKA